MQRILNDPNDLVGEILKVGEGNLRISDEIGDSRLYYAGEEGR